MSAGVIFPTSIRLSPVSLTELHAYCYESLHMLNILSNSATGSGGVFLGDQQSNDTWEPNQENLTLLESTPLWESLLSAYNYAELGLPLQMDEGDIHILLTDLAQWFCATFAYREFNGYPTWAGEKVIYKFIARLKLDYQWDVIDKFIAIESNWYPLTHGTHLTILDVALLAGMESIRSVRNATYDKQDSLEILKDGRNVLVTVQDARRWLQGRKGFVPTLGMNYGNNS